MPDKIYPLFHFRNIDLIIAPTKNGKTKSINTVLFISPRSFRQLSICSIKVITKVQGMLPFLPKMPGAVRPIALAGNHESLVNLTLTIAAQNFACKWDGYRI